MVSYVSGDRASQLRNILKKNVQLWSLAYAEYSYKAFAIEPIHQTKYRLFAKQPRHSVTTVNTTKSYTA